MSGGGANSAVTSDWADQTLRFSNSFVHLVLLDAGGPVDPVDPMDCSEETWDHMMLVRGHED